MNDTVVITNQKRAHGDVSTSLTCDGEWPGRPEEVTTDPWCQAHPPSHSIPKGTQDPGEIGRFCEIQVLVSEQCDPSVSARASVHSGQAAKLPRQGRSEIQRLGCRLRRCNSLVYIQRRGHGV
jgi:hypothetical protein